ncbi:MAG: DUF348 domain-containing protein [Ruminococcaceae bacterium]|nr:DUF348 domain-containing protein [Oscillospiraceae bacterium]
MQRHLERVRRRLHWMPTAIKGLAGATILAGCLWAVVPSVVAATADEPLMPTLTRAAPANGAGGVAPEAIEDPETPTALPEEVAGPPITEAAIQQAASVTLSHNLAARFSVALLDDGQLQMADVAGGTVGELLDELGVVLEGEDFVWPPADTELEAGMLPVEISRVRYTEEVRREQMDAATVDGHLAQLGAEAAEGFTRGYNNTYDVTYRDRVVNGEVTYSAVLAIEPLPAPVGNQADYHNDFSDVAIGPDGVPTSYAWKMGGAVTTAYSSSGGRGASGLGLYHGTVAVNPNVIPYGTRMYITSPDGSYVYGYAIATDTGIALMDGRVDIDLYFGSNAECYAFGKRAMDVYILG